MKAISVLIGTLMLNILLSGCEKQKDPDKEPVLVFSYEYVNYAWGHQNWGINILSDGRVYYFNILQDHEEATNKTSPPNFGDLVLTLDLAEVNAKLKILEQASEGTLSDPENRYNDYGTITYQGYLWDSSQIDSTKVLLKQYGDWTIINDAEEAEEICLWLDDTYLEVLDKITDAGE